MLHATERLVTAESVLFPLVSKKSVLVCELCCPSVCEVVVLRPPPTKPFQQRGHAKSRVLPSPVLILLLIIAQFCPDRPPWIQVSRIPSGP